MIIKYENKFYNAKEISIKWLEEIEVDMDNRINEYQ